MAKRKSTRSKKTETQVQDYRHESEKRKNIPPAKIAAEGAVPAVPKTRYEYNPHLPPVLRFDQHGKFDELPELLAEARRRPLTDDEARLLAEALRTREPWLEWTGKREAKYFEVDPVALHIHERVSAQAILKVARRQDVARTLFGDPEQDYHEAVQFYRHDVDWTNRLILGDSLEVMSSLAKRENLAGKVQMIYIDPPYGIKFASNFQPEIGNLGVSDREQDLTREPEMVRAYRDTWQLGIHSYLGYLRDRLCTAKDLLTETGSIFVQIGEENRHRIRLLMEEVFGADNFVREIAYKTSIGLGGAFLDEVCNYLVWFARDKSQAKYRQLWQQLELGGKGATRYTKAESICTGEIRLLTQAEQDDPSGIPSEWKPLTDQGLTSRSGSETTGFGVQAFGQTYRPTAGGWRTGAVGMQRVLESDRVLPAGRTIRFKKFFEDSGTLALTNFWDDVGGGIQSRNDPKVYVVQTATNVVRRCMLMTTDPGDLVLDPTCGSGTTAFVAEQWGRRWIMIDTSRVALAIARQRLLTSSFKRFRVRGEDEDGNGRPDHRPGVDPHPGFVYRTGPHIMLRDIAQNPNLDPIFAKHQTIIEAKLELCNAALRDLSKGVRQVLEQKLILKEKEEGKRAVTDADRRRWILPPENRAMGSERKKKQKNCTVDLEYAGWYHWEVPFDTDDDWSEELQAAVTDYRKAWRAKMDEVNACLAANTDQKELVDQPEIVRGVVRVSGPFTVEAVQPPEMSLGDADTVTLPAVEEGLFDGEPGEMGAFEVRPVESFADTQNIPAYLEKMIRLLKTDAVTFPSNRVMKFSRLEPIFAESGAGLHAEGRWDAADREDDDPEGPASVCVVFGPQYGPVTAKQVEDVVRPANRAGYADLVIAGFSFDGPAQAVIEEVGAEGRIRLHMAHIRPDVNPGMDGLLKDQPGSQLFTVFGQPRTRLDGPDKDGQYVVYMEGVDIYNPVDNSVAPTSADKVAAWFIDGDYDDRTFCITQAFFPDRSAWSKLARALKGVVDEDRFDALSGTTSLPFPAGKHKRVAVKVIDPRGNEVMRVHGLEKA